MLPTSEGRTSATSNLHSLSGPLSMFKVPERHQAPPPCQAVGQVWCLLRSACQSGRSLRPSPRWLPPGERQTWVRLPLSPWVFFQADLYQWLKKKGRQWLPCHSLGVTESALGLVGQVSVYCKWVRETVWYAASTSGCQYVQLSEHYPSLRYTSILLGR